MAVAFSWIASFAVIRDVYVHGENPVQTTLKHHPSIRLAISMLNLVYIFTYMGAFLPKTLGLPKGTWLITSLPDKVHYMLKTSKSMLPDEIRPQRNKEYKENDFHKITRTGWVQGGKKLKGTEQYPSGYGQQLQLAVTEAISMSTNKKLKARLWSLVTWRADRKNDDDDDEDNEPLTTVMKKKRRATI